MALNTASRRLSVCPPVTSMTMTTSVAATSGATRRCHSSPAPSTSKAAVSRKAAAKTTVEFPTFLRPRLDELRTNIIDQLAGRDRIPAFMRLRQAAMTSSSSSPSASSFPTMEQMARLYFERGGKLFRPTIAMLMASACNQEVVARGGRVAVAAADEDISSRQASIALIAEMIHVASLVHDDVIDEADTRRGAPSVSGCWGNKMAVLAGDFILARATQALCAIGDPTVISTMATIIEDLVVGEFLQMSPELSPSSSSSTTVSPFSPSSSTVSSPSTTVSSSSTSFTDRLSLYLAKSERKTASLFANSCRSVAMLADGADGDLQTRAAEYGRHVGLAFQLVDDAIDYELEDDSEGESAGKPIAVDLEQGLITGPLLLSANSDAELAALLRPDVSAAEVREAVRRSGACERTRALATQHAQHAADIACSLRSTNGASEALADLALRQLERRS